MIYGVEDEFTNVAVLPVSKLTIRQGQSINSVTPAFVTLSVRSSQAVSAEAAHSHRQTLSINSLEQVNLIPQTPGRIYVRQNQNVTLLSGGGWLPSSMGNLVGWFDASKSSSITNDGSGNCSQWNDLSANANNVTQGTLANRPQISGTINGLQTLTFNGTSGFLEKDTATSIPSLATGLGFGMVLLATNVTNRGPWDISDNLTTNRTMQFIMVNNAQVRSVAAGASIVTFTDTVNPHLFSGTVSTTLRDLYLDGTEGSPSLTTLSSLNSVNFRIGALFQNTFFFAGKMGELVWFSGASSTDRQKVEGYLAWKWGLQNNLPLGHPYKNAPPFS